MEIDATTPDGNAYAIMGYVRRLLEASQRIEEWPAAQKRMMSGNYDNLCDVAEEVTFGSIKIINRHGEEE